MSLGVTGYVDDMAPAEYATITKRSMIQQLAVLLAEHLLNNQRTVVEIQDSERKVFGGRQLMLEAKLTAVQYRDIVMPRLVLPAEPLEWECNRCGVVNLTKLNPSCRNCNHVQY